MKNFLFILTFIFTFQITNAQDNSAENKHRSVFIYNFSKYIEWPVEKDTGNFVIAVYGTSKLVPELKKMIGLKTIGNQPIEIQQYHSPDSIGACHILYIPTEYSSYFNSIMISLEQTNTLVITEEEGLIDRGAAINFVKAADRIEFEINLMETYNRNLKVKSELTNELAIRVIK